MYNEDMSSRGSGDETPFQASIRIFIGLLLVALVVLIATGCSSDKFTQATVTAKDGSVGPAGARGQIGQTGASGQNGVSPQLQGIWIVSYIRPCGETFNGAEIFLRMSDNNILALYDGGPHEDRLTLLYPGNFITTDRNSNHTCHFTINAQLQITNERVY